MGNTLTVAEEILPLVDETKSTFKTVARVTISVIILHLVLLIAIFIMLMMILHKMG